MDNVRASVSINTRRAYRADLLHFLCWGGAIPASSKTVAEYLAVQAEALLRQPAAWRWAAHGARPSDATSFHGLKPLLTPYSAGPSSGKWRSRMLTKPLSLTQAMPALV